MQHFVETKNKNNAETLRLSDEDLHTQANKYIWEAHYLVFQALPGIIEQIIEHEIWKEKNYKNFGEYALKQSSNGLSITNNHRLWLLKCAMDINGQHAGEWGDVLNEVDSSVRVYAKENKIPIKDLNSSLNGMDDKHMDLDEKITYLPSRSKSNDGQLLKLRKKDQETYNKVVQGQIKLKDTLPPNPKKQAEPIESVKDKFNNLSNTDREAFLSWIAQQKKDLEKN